MEEVILIYSTCPTRQSAVELSRELLNHRLAACVNIGAEMTSLYTWEGELKQEPEVPLVIKAVKKNFAAIKDLVLKLHPYDCPSLLAMDISCGHEPFLKWVREMC